MKLGEIIKNIFKDVFVLEAMILGLIAFLVVLILLISGISTLIGFSY